jgi:alkylation response protein AidB-like acyl-CoA dehydrogenase
VDFDLSPDEQAYRDEVRAWLKANAPRASDDGADQKAYIESRRAWQRKLYEAGYVGITWPKEYGGQGLGFMEQLIFNDEMILAHAPEPINVIGLGMGGPVVIAHGTDEQKKRYLAPLLSAEEIWCQGFSEPNAGSDLSGLQTRAEDRGDHYVVNGQKVWSTWAQHADFGYLLARTEAVPGPAGISAFILDMNSPGVTTRPLREITGTRDFNEVFLEDVAVPAANMIGAPGEGWRVAGASLAQERGGVGAGGSGGAISRLVSLARTCRRNGEAAIDNAAVRQDVGAFVARSRIQRYLGYAVSTRAALGTTQPSDAPTTKIWFSELNLELSEYALMLQGPRGALLDNDALDDGYWQDAFLYARAWTIAGGSNEIMRNLIAERGLGLPREPRTP